MADRAPSVPVSSAPPSLRDGGRRRPPGRAVSRRGLTLARFGDRIYAAVTFLASLSIFVIILWLLWQLTGASLPVHPPLRPARSSPSRTGTRRRTATTPCRSSTERCIRRSSPSCWPCPVSVGAAIFLSELAPRWIRTPATFLIELLAAIPSVVYGLWGIFILIPFLKAFVFKPVLNSRLPHLPVIGGLFGGQAAGYSMLAAGMILAIMVTPFITAVTRDILRAIPRAQREGSYALGATQWETIAQVVIPYAKSGIIGAVILGLGRALGETMAVTMLIGNQSPNTPSGISFSLFDSGYTMSSVLANKFNEAIPGLNISALVEIGLVLFCVTIVVNICARLLVFYTAKDVQGGK